MGIKNQFSIAIIGAGYMAEEHIKAFESIGGVTVSGIFSRTPEKAVALAQKYTIQHVCASVSELYAKTNADLVVIAITETAVQKVVDELVKYDWCFLMEKPVGLSLSTSMNIKEKIEANKRQALVALNRRFYSSTQNIVHDLTQSQGRRLIHVQDYESLQIARSFNYANEIIEGWMYANSIHLIDYFNVLGRGEIVDVNVVQPWRPDRQDPVLAHIRYDSGDEGIYQGIWHGPGPWSVSVTTESDYFEMRPLEQATRRTVANRTPSSYEMSSDDMTYKPGLRRQAQEAISFLKQENNLSVTLEESMKTMRLIKQIYG